MPLFWCTVKAATRRKLCFRSRLAVWGLRSFGFNALEQRPAPSSESRSNLPLFSGLSSLIDQPLDRMNKTLVVVPTYNERDNLPPLAQRLLSLSISVDMLVVDDNSPDGTGKI